jgi:hypothetical protein
MDEHEPQAAGKLSRAHRWWVRDTLRYLHAQSEKEQARAARPDGGKGELCHVAKSANRSWGSLAPEARLALVSRALVRPGLEEWQTSALEAYRAELQQTRAQPDRRQEKYESREARVKATSVLLTWQGPWGVVDDDTVQRRGPALEAVVRALRAHPACQCLWEGVQQRLQCWAQRLGLQSWATSVEVCVRTLEEEGEARVHVHAFIQRSAQLRDHELRQLLVGGSSPHRADGSAHSRARGRALQSAYSAGLYYCQAPKVGQLWCTGNKRPFKDYLIASELITQMWQQDKMSDEDTVAQYVLHKKDVERNVANLRRQVAYREELALAAKAQAARAQLQETVRPPRKVPEVEQWLKDQARAQFRQKFLVLDGPSQLGKTRFAHSLRGAHATLDVNCSGVQSEPDLRSFRACQHATILFDEASAAMVVRNKKLFQAPPDPVQLGQSSTNCFAYAICVHQCLLVVASNKWSAELQELSEEDQAWLQKNQVYVHVQEPLWEQ